MRSVGGSTTQTLILAHFLLHDPNLCVFVKYTGFLVRQQHSMSFHILSYKNKRSLSGVVTKQAPRKHLKQRVIFDSYIRLSRPDSYEILIWTITLLIIVFSVYTL